MRNILLTTMLLFAVVACNQSSTKTDKKGNSESEAVLAGGSSVVNVYYFHGKQRCKTCVAVGNVAKETIEKHFREDSNVRFADLDTSDKANAALLEKYDVSWNALIISKGDKYEDITEDAFATAVGNPEKLSADILSVVNSLLEE